MKVVAFNLNSFSINLIPFFLSNLIIVYCIFAHIDLENLKRYMIIIIYYCLKMMKNKQSYTKKKEIDAL